MENADLADEIISRLNQMIENPDIRADLGRLIESRVPCSPATVNHPTIQVHGNDAACGFLGWLNGFIGIVTDGPCRGMGYVAAVFDDDMKLERFRRTDKADQDRLTESASKV